MDRLEKDISTWNSLYTSGRLQKPVCMYMFPQHHGKHLEEAQVSFRMASYPGYPLRNCMYTVFAFDFVAHSNMKALDCTQGLCPCGYCRTRKVK